MNRVLSFDIGGTKTGVAYYDELGNLIGSLELGSCHILQVDEDLIKFRLNKGLELLDGCVDVFIVLGWAGYGSNLEMRKKIELLCAEIFFGYRYLLVNDAELALESALGGDDGILVIAGTGSIGLAKKNDQIYRCGGFGYLLGDEGSGYSIGLQALKSVCLMEDNRLPKSALYRCVLAFGDWKNAYDMLGYIYNNSDIRGRIAGFSKIVGDLFVQGDEYCGSLIDNAAAEIAAMVNHLLMHFSGRVCASGVGGIFNNLSGFSELVIKKLDKRIDWHKADHDINYGGYLLAKKDYEFNKY